MYELAFLKNDLTIARNFLFLTPVSQITIKLQFPVDDLGFPEAPRVRNRDTEVH
jgi:hypothetical protein